MTGRGKVSLPVFSSAEKVHTHVFHRWNAKLGPRYKLQREKDVVVIADDPPELGITQVAVGDKIDAIAGDNGVQPVVVSGCGIDPLPPAEIFTGRIAVKDAAGVAGIAADHERTCDQLTD